MGGCDLGTNHRVVRTEHSVRRAFRTLASVVFFVTASANADERILVENVSALPKRVCSFELPLCVSAEKNVSNEHVLRALQDAETLFLSTRAWFDLPFLPRDAGTEKIEIRVLHGETAARVVLRHRSPFGGFDRASGVVEVGDAAFDACALREHFFASLVELTTLTTNPALDRDSQRAMGEVYARRFALCGREVTPYVRPLPPKTEPAPSTILVSSAAFYEWLDERASDGRLRAPHSFLALSPTSTPEANDRWNDDPDLFDVLRESTRGLFGTGTVLGSTLLRYAEHGVETGTLAATWAIPFPTAPRRLLGDPLRVGGAGVISIDAPSPLDGGRPPTLRVEANWESPAEMQVSALVETKEGSFHRVEIAGMSRAMNAQGTVVETANAKRIHIVVAYTGEWYAPLDPDLEFSDRGYAVSLAPE